MARLSMDRTVVSRLAGVDLTDHLLAPRSHLASRVAWPICVMRTADGATLVVRDLERANVEGVHPRVPVVYFGAYQVLGRRSHATATARSLVEAILVASGTNDITADSDVPAAIVMDLRSAGTSVRVESSPMAVRRVLRVPRCDVSREFQEAQTGLIAIATRIGNAAENGQELRQRFERRGNRFELLDAVLADMGAAGAVFCSPISLQAIGGHWAYGASHAIVPREGREVWLLFPQRTKPDSGASCHVEDLKSTVRSLLGDGASVAIEEEYVSCGEWTGLTESLTLLRGHLEFTRWRELVAWMDLPGYIVAAAIGADAINVALAQAQEGLQAGRGISELDLNVVYENQMASSQSLVPEGYRVKPLFTNLHASSRSTYPALPTKAFVTPQSRAIKIDAGVVISGPGGIILGTSDVARSLPLSQEAESIYRALKLSVCAGLSVIRAGTSGAHIHETTVRTLANAISASRELEHIAAEVGDIQTAFSRNVGHLTGIQESFTSQFRPGTRLNVFEGSIGSVEVHWTTEALGLGYEDMFFTMREGVCPISTLPIPR